MNPGTIAFAVGAVALIALYVFSGIKKSKTQARIKELLQQGAIVLDVRSRSEYNSGAFSGARNTPLDAISKGIKGISKDSNIIVYCASGARSASAAQILKSQGYVSVLDAGPLSRLTALQD